jgi:hypothetical protein
LPKLTKSEQHILRFPPNAGTWECNRKSKLNDSDDEYICHSIQSRREKDCVICRQPKSRRAIELRPLYLAACAKAGVEPEGVA